MEKETNQERPSGATKEETNSSTNSKVKTRQGSGYLKQLYSTARTTTATTHTHLKNLTTFLVNFVPTEKVDASELQVRVHFDQAEIDALAASIKLHGVLQPILVVQDGERYKVIAGERRLRAAKQAGLDRIPARVLSTDDKATHEIALRENLDRVDLHPLEEGEGYVSLLETQAYTSHDTIAKAFGKPKSRITECIGFTRLPDVTKQELMRTGIKNRALLRHLLTVPADTHIALIAEAATKEEVLGANGGANGAASGNPAGSAKSTTSGAKEIKAFTYQWDDKALQVPSFKWKSNESQEKLLAYSDALRKLLTQIEEKLTAPQS